MAKIYRMGFINNLYHNWSICINFWYYTTLLSHIMTHIDDIQDSYIRHKKREKKQWFSRLCVIIIIISNQSNLSLVCSVTTASSHAPRIDLNTQDLNISNNWILTFYIFVMKQAILDKEMLKKE